MVSTARCPSALVKRVIRTHEPLRNLLGSAEHTVTRSIAVSCHVLTGFLKSVLHNLAGLTLSPRVLIVRHVPIALELRLCAVRRDSQRMRYVWIKLCLLGTG